MPNLAPPDPPPGSENPDAHQSKKSRQLNGSSTSAPPAIPQSLMDRRKKLSFRDTLMSEASSTSTVAEDESEFQFENSEFIVEDDDDDDMDEETCLMILVSKEEILDWFQPWKKALVVKVIGKNLSPYIIIEQVKYLWKIKSKLYATDLGNGYIVFRFSNDSDYETALFGGPWLISNHYLLVQKYIPFLILIQMKSGRCSVGSYS